MGDAHTNTIEGLWSLVKRGIGGVNHAVSAKHLQTYLNEYAFRYNPDEWQTHSVLAGTSPRPTVWAVLAWDEKIYRGTFTAQDSGRWYFSISSTAPVPGMESDQGIGYSGPRYAWDVIPASSTSQPFSWVWVGALIALALLAVTALFAALRRKNRTNLTRQHLTPDPHLW